MESGMQIRGDIGFVCVTAGGIIADRLSRHRGDFTANTVRDWKRCGWFEPDIRALMGEFEDLQQLLKLVVHSAVLITACWPGVEAIAQVLLEPRELSYAEAGTLFYDAIRGVAGAAGAADREPAR
jgi:hypothetical protein